MNQSKEALHDKQGSVTVPGATLKLMLDALKFYADGNNFDWVTFGQGRAEQLNRLSSDSSWIQDADDSRGHERFHEDGSKAAAALKAFDCCFVQAGVFNHEAYDAITSGNTPLYAGIEKGSQ